MTVKRVEPREAGMPTSGLWIAVGHPKCGKSTTFAKFPGARVLMLELAGGDNIQDLEKLDVLQITDTLSEDGQVVTKTALDEFGDELERAITEESVKYIIIDTVDELVNWIGADILRGQNKDPNSAKPQEKNFAYWDELRNRISSLCKYLKESGKLVIMIAHCKAPELNDKKEVIVPAGFNVSGKGGAYLGANADAIAYISKRKVGSAMQQFCSFESPSDLAIWGSRIPELDGKSFPIPRTDPHGAFAANFVQPKPAAKPAPAKAPAASGKKR